MPQPRLVLASTSAYRRELLNRLGLDFECMAPGADETPLPGEAHHALATRLARAKAEAVRAAHPGAVIIGCDQVAVLEDGRVLGKPGDHAAAAAQLRAMSGRGVEFLTALCVLGPKGTLQEHTETVMVRMRPLAADEIERYLLKDKPYDCAGSAKVEGAGVALTESISSHDPTALIGLPLIALCRMLRAEGIQVI